MENMFSKYTEKREEQQDKIENAVTEGGEEKRTTLSLSLTVADKKALKLMATEQETTIAAIIHGWIAEHSKEVDE
ncbi:MAG: hypothetical protein HXO72_03675 [Scardovia wiggsiae]|uniref:hypothetical protein n=1 Tax=Scardovia wiggsiae TaxID=230143 RepID=UPI001CB26BBD|nr:hypothetical protein [Scardovia wiggsiae]